MSLDRKDLRVYLDPDIHAALSVLAGVDGLEIAKLCEQVVERYVLDRVHAATVIAQSPGVAGLTRLRPVSPGSDRQTPAARGKAR